MPIATDWNINYITKQINHQQWKDELTGSSSSVAEIQTVLVVGVSGNIVSGNYFNLYSAKDETSYYVWYNVASGGGDPAPTGKTGIAVAVGGSDTAQQVSDATVAAINSVAGTDFTATNAGGSSTTITITNDNAGSCTSASNNTGLPEFTYTVTQTGVGETVWSVNALYSYLQDTFDELGQMDDLVPMSAQTPTEYSLINNWFIDEVSIKYLNGGAIKTIGWTRVEGTGTNIGIVQVGYSSSTVEPDTNDIGQTVTTSHGDGDTGTLLFADITRDILWIRPDTSVATDSFDHTSGTLTCSSGMSVTQTVVSITGENTWANMYTIGTIESNTAIYVVQDGSKLSAWWPVGHIDVLIRVREFGSSTGINGGDLTELFIGAREYSKLYDHFVSTGITGGRNPVPLATGADLNNTTGEYSIVLSSSSGTFTAGHTFTANANSDKQGTILSTSGSNPTITIYYYLSGTALTQFANTDAITTSGSATGTINGAPSSTSLVPSYSSGITFNWGTTGSFNRDLNNGNGTQPYYLEIDLGSTTTVAQMYEYLKYIAGRGYTNSPTQVYYDAANDGNINDTINGEQYIALRPETFTPVKASPFGTFAGGKFFGAQGVWIANPLSTDAQNYQLIDGNGSTQVPPNTVSVTVSSVVVSDVVGVFPLTAAGGTVEKDTYAVNTGAADANTLTVTGLIDTRTPQRGVLRIVDDSDTLKAEQQYEYYSWSTAGNGVFTLNSSANRSLTLTVTGGSGGSTILTDTEATFQTWRVRAGDIIDNTTDGSTATVVSVDSQTQLTTTTLTGGSDNTYTNTDSYTFTTELNRLYTVSDTVYVPIINETVWTGTEVSNTLIYTAPTIPVIVRVRQGKVILPFEIENTIISTGMSQAAIRTTDTIAT